MNAILMNSQCLFWMWMYLLWQRDSLSMYPLDKESLWSWSLSYSICLEGDKVFCYRIFTYKIGGRDLFAVCVWS